MKLLSFLWTFLLLGWVSCAQAQVPTAPPVTPSGAAESSHVFKAAAGVLYGFQVNTGASAVWVMVFNATSAPADGAVTPIKWYQVAANSTLTVTYIPVAIQLSTGITIVCSTTGPFTKTASSTCVFSGEAQ